MERNPFSDLLSIMDSRSKEVTETSFFYGTVVQGLPNIKVGIDGLELDRTNLIINSLMLVGNNAEIKCSTGNITHNLKDVVRQGDKLLLCRGVDGKFVILCKVVTL